MRFALAQSPAVLLSNREFAECLVGDSPESHIPDDLRALLYDPQTSGGLLISVALRKRRSCLILFKMPAFLRPSSDACQVLSLQALARQPSFCDDELLWTGVLYHGNA